MRSEWLQILQLSPDDDKPFRRVCSIHFEETCFNRSFGKNRLREHAIPTLHLTDDINEDSKENTNALK